LKQSGQEEKKMENIQKIRFRAQVGTESGHRKGWIKHVKDVDTTKTNGYAFIGDFLSPGKLVELPIGSILVCCDPQGSVAHPRKSGEIRIVTGPDADNLKDATDVIAEVVDYYEDFLVLRDAVIKALHPVLSSVSCGDGI